jgi:hypothetical protein
MCFIGYWWDVRLNFVLQLKFYVLKKSLKKYEKIDLKFVSKETNKLRGKNKI